jgi:hypothetical protein
VDGLDDAARIDLIRALEDLKAAASACQARVSVDFDESQRAAQQAAGVPAALLGRGIGAQVALARRESPHAGGRFLGLATALVREMPCTLAALRAGLLSEWRATVLARESACLTRQDRATFDRLVAGDPAALVGMGTRALSARARAVSLRLDAAAMAARARRAASDRCVSLRPAPDTMTYLTALLPVAQGVAVYADLTRAAEAARAAGDPRGRGQAMADELVARVLAGASPATSPAGTFSAAPDNPAHVTSGGGAGAGDWGNRPATRLQVQLVMPDRALLAGDDEPALIPGYGPVPGPWARDLVLDALTSTGHGGHGAAGSTDAASGFGGSGRGPLGAVQVWVRRLFTAPTTGQLVAMDSRARLAPRGLADLVRARDAGACRTPYCDAPIRHVDHVTPAADDGPTNAANLQGLCEGCNYAKQAPGWHQSAAPPADTGPVASGAPDVHITTPTGHRYASRVPGLPGGPPTGHHGPPASTRPSPRKQPERPHAAPPTSAMP